MHFATMIGAAAALLAGARAAALPAPPDHSADGPKPEYWNLCCMDTSQFGDKGWRCKPRLDLPLSMPWEEGEEGDVTTAQWDRKTCAGDGIGMVCKDWIELEEKGTGCRTFDNNKGGIP